MLAATMRLNKTGHFFWVGSDSWGAKLHPVRDQEFAAEGAITILPKRSSLAGEFFFRLSRNCRNWRGEDYVFDIWIFPCPLIRLEMRVTEGPFAIMESGLRRQGPCTPDPVAPLYLFSFGFCPLAQPISCACLSP